MLPGDREQKLLRLLAAVICLTMGCSSAYAQCPGCPPEGSLPTRMVLTYFYRTEDPAHERTLRVLQAVTESFPHLDLAVQDMAVQRTQDVRRILDDVYGVPSELAGNVPAVFVADKAFVGYQQIREGIIEIALAPWRESAGVVGKMTASLKKLKLLVITAGEEMLPVLVTAAGLIDGVNPCALSMLLFLVACLAMTEQKRRAILVTGSGVVAGSFAAYLMLGMGLLRITESEAFARVSDVVYLILGILTLAFGIVSIVDFVRIKTRGAGEMRLKLPSRWRRPLQRVMRTYAQRNQIGFLVGFLLGIAGSLIEFPCTGQIYLPTVSLLRGRGTWRGVNGYLVWYNLMFVIPLILVVGASAFFTQSQRVASFYSRHIRIFKLLAGCFFFCLSAYMFGLLA